MTSLGIALLIVGAALLVAEAHLPTAGVLGLFGVAALAFGGWAALTGVGAVAGVAIAVAVARRQRIRGGREGLVGHVGTARGADRVFVDGALWQARLSWPGDEAELHRGDPIVVERVKGLTLCVRKADRWEIEA